MKKKTAKRNLIKPKANEITAQRAEEYKLTPQGAGESDSSFRDRISGKLRDAGHIIEAHEAATNKLYNDESGEPMVGIMGAIAQKMQGKNYNVSGSQQVGCDVAAGHLQSPPRKPLGGLTPELAILLGALLGGR